MQQAMDLGKDDRETGKWVAGPLSFETSFRSISGDKGPSLRVIARQSLGSVTVGKQLIRYDCFQNYPHSHLFHADGTGGSRILRKGMTAAGAVEEAIAELRTSLSQTLRSLGYEELAASLGNYGADLAVAIEALNRQLSLDATQL